MYRDSCAVWGVLYQVFSRGESLLTNRSYSSQTLPKHIHRWIQSRISINLPSSGPPVFFMIRIGTTDTLNATPLLMRNQLSIHKHHHLSLVSRRTLIHPLIGNALSRKRQLRQIQPVYYPMNFSRLLRRVIHPQRVLWVKNNIGVSLRYFIAKHLFSGRLKETYRQWERPLNGYYHPAKVLYLASPSTGYGRLPDQLPPRLNIAMRNARKPLLGSSPRIPTQLRNATLSRRHLSPS